MANLHIDKIQAAMDGLGLSATALAEKLSVSKQTVSNWLNGRDMPRPDKLLRLSLALRLPLDQLRAPTGNTTEPIVAYRMKANRKARDDHFEIAIDRAHALQMLVRHLPFNALMAPPQLKDPKLDYGYVESVAASLRKEMKLSDSDHIQISHLKGHFKKLQTVIVPVLWGKKESHSNALHIYLPGDASTWTYLNLDSNQFDFMFWMAHELAHALTSELCGKDEGEDFADMLASSLLFPEACAQRTYEALSSASARRRMDVMLEHSAERRINLYTVQKQIKAYAKWHSLPEIQIAPTALHALRHQVDAITKTISVSLFGTDKPSAREFIAKCEEVFDTPIFKALSAYVKESGAEASYIQHVLGVPFQDAKMLRAELLL